jgi:enamidase
MKTAIVNIGTIVSGDWRSPFVAGDSILMSSGKLQKVGSVSPNEMRDCDLVIDANGVTAVPGFIDSHVHIAFADYTPRLKTVGFLEDYMYGGTTTAISACEVHVPGRPTDPEGVKALAVAAKKCWDNLRPGGMRVHAGNVILEPGLTDEDFQELAAKGIWLAKAGFGDVKTPYDYVPLIQAAKRAGMITNVHTGGASLVLANSIFGEHLVAMQPDVAFHVNGGPIAVPDADFERIVGETRAALQICQAGNIRTAILVLNLALKNDCYDRFLIATDTPTGIGVMPEGMIKSIAEMASLTSCAPEKVIAAATGNAAKVFRLNCGFLQAGKDADVLLIDAPLGASKQTALETIKNGDVTAGVACFTNGIPRYIGRSRCTPPPRRTPIIVRNELRREFPPPPLLT